MIQSLAHRCLLAGSTILIASTLVACGGPSGIVSLAPYLTEIACALGYSDDLLAVSTEDDYPYDVIQMAKAGTPQTPDVGMIQALKPAFVLVPESTPDLDAIAAATGTKVITAKTTRLDDVPNLIREIGTAMQAGQRAETLAAGIETQRMELEADLADMARPRTLIVLARNGNGVGSLTCAGPHHLASDVATLAATENVLADRNEPIVELTLDEVKALAPELILEFYPGDNYTSNQEQALFDAWNVAQEIPARAAAAIYFVTDSHALRPGPRIIEFSKQLAKQIHGDYEFERELNARAVQ